MAKTQGTPRAPRAPRSPKIANPIGDAAKETATRVAKEATEIIVKQIEQPKQKSAKEAALDAVKDAVWGNNKDWTRITTSFTYYNGRQASATITAIGAVYQATTVVNGTFRRSGRFFNSIREAQDWAIGVFTNQVNSEILL